MTTELICGIVAQGQLNLKEFGEFAERWGLVPALFTVLLFYFIFKLDGRITNIDGRFRDVEDRFTKVDERLSYWSTFIRENAPLGLLNPPACEVVRVALDRNVSEIMAYISEDLIFLATQDLKATLEDTMRAAGVNPRDPLPQNGLETRARVLKALLRKRTSEVLVDTREFLSKFRTSRGPLNTPLGDVLPVSRGLDGRQTGDREFDLIIGRIVDFLLDRSTSNHDKLVQIRAEVQRRRELTESVVVGWIEGRSSSPPPASQPSGAPDHGRPMFFPLDATPVG